MESLRRRMKLLESQTGSGEQDSPNAGAAAAANNTPSGHRSTSASTSAQNVSSNATTNPHASLHKKKRRRSGSANHSGDTHTQRSSKPRKRSRGSKFKRQLLFVYGVLIGAVLLTVLVLMIFNLFGSNPILPGGGATDGSTNASDSAEVDIEIDTKPDLEELRRAIENAEP